MANVEITGFPVDADSPERTIEKGDFILNPTAIDGPVDSITADATLTLDQRVIWADTSSGAIAVTLPAPDAEGRTFIVKKINTDPNGLTVDTADSATIDGGASITVSDESSVQIISDGTNWETI